MGDVSTSVPICHRVGQTFGSLGPSLEGGTQPKSALLHGLQYIWTVVPSGVSSEYIPRG